MLKNILHFFLFSNIYVATPVTCMTWQTFLLLGKETDWVLLTYIYLATLFLYCFHRLYKLEKQVMPFHSERHIWAIQHRAFMNGLTVVSGVGALVFSFLLPAFVFYWLAIPAVIGLGYTLPLLPYKKGFLRLRDVPFAKVMLIALVVAWITVILPMVVSDHSFDWLMLAERFFFILAITIPFDIRDLKYDQEEELLTLPVRFGEKTAKIISIVCLLLFIGLAALNNYSPSTLFALSISGILSTAIIWLTHQHRPEYYFSFLVEGTMVLQFVSIYIL